MDSYGSSEIDGAKTHIAYLKETIVRRKALLLLDRNYGSLEFIDYLECEGVKYIIRLRKGRYEVEKSLIIGEDGEVELLFNGERLKGIKEKRPERALELKELGSRGYVLKRLSRIRR
jgi:hypothetical protein